MFCLISLESLLLLHRFGLDCTRKQKLYTNFTRYHVSGSFHFPFFRFQVKVTIKRKSQLSFLLFLTYLHFTRKRSDKIWIFYKKKKNEKWKELDSDYNFSYQFFQKQWHPLVRPCIMYRNAYLLWKLSQPIKITICIINLTIQSIISKILR